MDTTPDDTDGLIERAGRGDASARGRILERHRARLRRMVAVRLDRRLAARVDPSDLVQEALAEASAGLDSYLRRRPLPLYPWLRQFAWERICKAHRTHLHARRRSVAREEAPPPAGEPTRSLDRSLPACETSPSRRAARAEEHRRLREALLALEPHDREVLVMRLLEQMETPEIAAALGISAGAVRNRQYRALIRLRALLGGDQP